MQSLKKKKRGFKVSRQNIRTLFPKGLGLEDEIDTWGGKRVLAVKTEAGLGQMQVSKF